MAKSEADYWRVIYVASRQEKKVASRLAALSIRHYLPLSKQLRQWSDRRKWVEFPMFNGYLFVQPEAHQIDQVLTQPGAVNYLYFNKQPARVTPREIEIIKQIEKSGYSAEHCLEPEAFTEGETITITQGPLKGFNGLLIRKDNDHYFQILIESIGQGVKVKLPLELISKTHSH